MVEVVGTIVGTVTGVVVGACSKVGVNVVVVGVSVVVVGVSVAVVGVSVVVVRVPVEGLGLGGNISCEVVGKDVGISVNWIGGFCIGANTQ
jgi:hypothetical protein